MKKYALLTAFLFLGAHITHADVVAFVFVTPPQTVLPSTLSGPITIQSQNESGILESILETTDLSFTSTSPTGQFVSATGKTISRTMAKGTANRTFYYSDSVLGTYTLTVTATERTSKKVFSTTQQITVASTLPAKPTPVIKITEKTISTKSKIVKSSIATTTKKTTNKLDMSLSEDPISSATNTAVVYEAQSDTTFFNSLLDWPGNFWKWLIHIF